MIMIMFVYNPLRNLASLLLFTSIDQIYLILMLHDTVSE